MPTIRALQLLADREIALVERDAPPPPGAGEVQLRVRYVGLNHIDVWGFRGMAFAQANIPAQRRRRGGVRGRRGRRRRHHADPRRPRGAVCRAGLRHLPRLPRGRENLCENVAGVRGFHVDGFAQELTNHPARLTAKLPDAVDLRDAACVAVAYATVEHMLFDNARLEPGEWILVHAGGSGIGSIAIRVAKSIGCTVITTVGSDDKAAKAHDARRRSRHQLPHRPVRGRGAQAHRPQGRRCGVRACRRRHLERLAAVDEARRTAGDLRRDVRAVRQHQPDAAVPAAVSHHRLVRLAAERARPRAGPHRVRRAAGDRHGVPLDEFRAGLARLESRDVFGKMLVEL